MKVSILGTEYNIIEKECERFDKFKADGFCEWWKKEIHILKDIQVEDEESMLGLDKYKYHVIKHEIVHAFLFESGMKDYERDEVIVEWIARNLEKINKALESLEGVKA